EMQPNEDARSKVEVDGSREKEKNDGKQLAVVKDTKNTDRHEKSVEELCKEVVEILKDNPNMEQWRQAKNILSQVLSKEENYPIDDEMVNCGLVPFLVKGLEIDEEQIQYQCVKALVNIVKSRDAEKIVLVVESGATDPL
ncbi:hypothetical protein PMAYCL1PPCAC_26437, partial [Pristionchus mayeri]